MISFACVHCGKHFQVSDQLAGKMGKCKSCGGLILVPSPDAVAPPLAPLPQPLTARPPAPAAPPPLPAPPVPRYQPPSFAPPLVPPTPFSPPPQIYASPYPQQPVVSPAQMGYASPPLTSPETPRLPMRMRRLQADAAQVQKAFATSQLIRVQTPQGNLPERYVIEFHVRGLVRGVQGPVFQDQHYAEIQLTSEYPRQSPKCRMLSPIFHPNIEPATICVGDHWTAGERLVDLIVRIAEMIGYQAYNIKSPLDGEAAMWADQNRHVLPTDRRDMRPAEL